MIRWYQAISGVDYSADNVSAQPCLRLSDDHVWTRAVIEKLAGKFENYVNLGRGNSSVVKIGKRGYGLRLLQSS